MLLRKLSIVVVPIVAVLFGACGSDATDSGATTPAPLPASTGSNASTVPPASGEAAASSTAGDASTNNSGATTVIEGSPPTMSTGPIDPGLKPYIDIAVADL